MIQQCVRLRHHPQAWKNAKEVMPRKPNKLYYTAVKSYRVIILPNCLGKICDKVVASMLTKLCEINNLLYEGQMGSRWERSVIDAVARLFSQVQEAWAEGRLAGMLLIDVNWAFDHVSRSYLLRTMERINSDGDFLRRTESLISDRRIGLVIDSNQCAETGVGTGVPQGSLVSPVLFVIYVSRVFRKVEKEVE